MQLTGIHHLTAISARIAENKAFYTQVLGLRLVKKSVNQDDVSAYHLFYADGVGSPGTDITFFDWPALPERRGTRSIVRTGFRVAADSLEYWESRLGEQGVRHSGRLQRDGREVIDFEDPENQRLSLVADEASSQQHPWDRSPVPAQHQILGLGPITLSVPVLESTDTILTKVLNMRPVRQYSLSAATSGDAGSPTVHVYAMGDGGAAAELHVAVESSLGRTHPGAGGVHHVAFRVPDVGQYDQWNRRLQELNIRNSGPVDRFYFKSLYFREPNGILFELATDGPGFDADEPMASLGERLALPPFLEPRRKEIEANLKPL